MPLLIDIPSTVPLPQRLVLREGDVVRLGGTGARTSAADEASIGVAEVLGPFAAGAAGPRGEVVGAVGTPAVILVIARRAGAVTVEVARGGGPGNLPPGRAVLSSTEVVVEAGPR